MREQKSPRAWVKTARRWDIIGRGIGMGWFRCSPSCVAKAPTSLPPRACNHENFGNEEPHGNGHGKGGEGDHPLNGLANHAKPEIGSDFGGFAADRGRLGPGGRGRENVKDGGWRKKESFRLSSSANLPKLSWNVPPYDAHASSRETMIESHVSFSF